MVYEFQFEKQRKLKHIFKKKDYVYKILATETDFSGNPYNLKNGKCIEFVMGDTYEPKHFTDEPIAHDFSYNYIFSARYNLISKGCLIVIW
jgi:hypothetical protein